jgi:predicted ATPase
MNYIEHILIEDFWGDKTVDLELKDSQNFIIGVNGSGKTTIINLIAAAITADYRTLDNSNFRKIILTLRSTTDRRIKPIIEVTKSRSDFLSSNTIEFKIRQKSNEEPLIQYLNNEEDDDYRRRRTREEYIDLFPDHSSIDGFSLRRNLSKLLNISWLSIQRFKLSRRSYERSHESLIDQKIREFTNNFVKYQSELKNKSAEETDKFQKFIFLSLLTADTKERLLSSLNTINPEKEKEALNQIYSLFDVPIKDFRGKLNKYFKSYIDSKNKSDTGVITLKDAEYLIGMRRIHSIVQEWTRLEKKQEDIFQFRDTFIELFNKLLQRKRLIINERSELVIQTQSEKELDLLQLSSGEKQLLIILGEALLQHNQHHIYIADEPELSLHVEWQEKLVDSLKSLNPNSQIIFATHSPDIVSHFSDSVLNIEDYIA